MLAISIALFVSSIGLALALRRNMYAIFRSASPDQHMAMILTGNPASFGEDKSQQLLRLAIIRKTAERVAQVSGAALFVLAVVALNNAF